MTGQRQASCIDSSWRRLQGATLLRKEYGVSRIFGPVASRRLGRSLGIDVVPYKTCTFDCVYCECGRTTDLTCERREFYPLEDILSELAGRLESIAVRPDVLTLSGAGEPTLYSRLGELIGEMHGRHGMPVAVITNSSLLGRPDVREELMSADIVVPSLDTAVEETFRRINRPHAGCSLSGIIEGLDEFLSGFEGKVYLEILLVEGFNTAEGDLEALRKNLKRWRLDSIQLNTAVRPGPDDDVGPLPAEEMERIRRFFGERCEIIAGVSSKTLHEDESAVAHILAMIERRPCTAEDINRALGIPVPGAIKFLAGMCDSGAAKTTEKDGLIYYTAVKRDGSS